MANQMRDSKCKIFWYKSCKKWLRNIMWTTLNINLLKWKWANHFVVYLSRLQDFSNVCQASLWWEYQFIFYWLDCGNVFLLVAENGIFIKYVEQRSLKSDYDFPSLLTFNSVPVSKITHSSCTVSILCPSELYSL